MTQLPLINVAVPPVIRPSIPRRTLAQLHRFTDAVNMLDLNGWRVRESAMAPGLYDAGPKGGMADRYQGFSMNRVIDLARSIS